MGGGRASLETRECNSMIHPLLRHPPLLAHVHTSVQMHVPAAWVPGSARSPLTRHLRSGRASRRPPRSSPPCRPPPPAHGRARGWGRNISSAHGSRPPHIAAWHPPYPVATFPRTPCCCGAGGQDRATRDHPPGQQRPARSAGDWRASRGLIEDHGPSRTSPWTSSWGHTGLQRGSNQIAQPMHAHHAGPTPRCTIAHAQS